MAIITLHRTDLGVSTVDISDADLRAIAAREFDLAERADGTWYCRDSRMFRYLPADAVTRAGKLVRTGEHYDAFKVLLDAERTGGRIHDLWEGLR